MSILTIEQAAKDAYDAGFRGADLVRIIATALAESSLNTNPSGNPSLLGILQFDAGTAAQAGYTHWYDMLDPRKAFQAAYNLVYGKNGAPRRGFQPWKGDNYQHYLSQAGPAARGAEAFGPLRNASNNGNYGPSTNGIGVSLPSFPSAADIGGAVSNAAMDAGRSLLPYLVILGILGVGILFVYSGVSPANQLRKAV